MSEINEICGWVVGNYEDWKDAVYQAVDNCDRLTEESKLFVKELDLYIDWCNDLTPQDVVESLIYRQEDDNV